MTIEDIYELVATDFDATDQLIRQNLTSQVPLTNIISDYIISNGGKRLRPLLTLLLAKALDYRGTQHHTLAAIVEIIHTATLLHDDVVDNSGLRRGKKTANIIWDNPEAVLSGDFLYSKAFVLMAHLRIPDAMILLTESTNRIADGEMLQLLNVRNVDTTEADYFDVIYHKTGKLFEAACVLPGFLVDASTETHDTLANFGRHLGTAFQLIDDVLDYTASAEEMGKNLGDDLAEGKPTLPIIYALQHSAASDRELLRQAILQGNTEDVVAIQTIVQASGGIAYTQSKAIAEVEQAKQNLHQLVASDYRAALETLCDYAIERCA